LASQLAIFAGFLVVWFVYGFIGVLFELLSSPVEGGSAHANQLLCFRLGRPHTH
jgi:hypothetical protein